MNETPDLSSYIVGWRGWWIVNDELYSLAPRPHGGPWPVHTANSAQCMLLMRSFDVHNPTKCFCGIYAYKTREGLMRNLSSPIPNQLCMGRVALWGRVMEHEDGWRAEYAYPLSASGASKALLRRYGMKPEPTIRSGQHVLDKVESWLAALLFALAGANAVMVGYSISEGNYTFIVSHTVAIACIALSLKLGKYPFTSC